MGTHPIFESDFDCLTDMESDPYLALAADCRRYGNVHTKRHVGINVQEEILIEAVAQFKRAIEEAKLQVFSNQELSLNLSNELRLKQRLLDEEQKTTDKLINDKKDLIMKLAESRERILQLEHRLRQFEDAKPSETVGLKLIPALIPNSINQPPPLPPKSSKPVSEKEPMVTGASGGDCGVTSSAGHETPPELPKKTRKPSTMIQRKKKLP